MPSTIRSLVQRRPLVAFFVIAYAYSWSYIGLATVATDGELGFFFETPYPWGPVIAAAVVLWATGGDLRAWLGQVRKWRIRPRWYVAGAAFVLLGTDIEGLVAFALGAEVSLADTPLLYYVAPFVMTLVLAGALEEFGWRAFAQVRLQERFSALVTNVLIGILWAFWHLPLFFVIDYAYDPAGFGRYVVTLVGLSVFFGWLYNSTGGALPVVMFTHAASNMPGLLDITGATPALIEAVPLSAVWYVGVAAVVAVYAGPTRLTRGGSLPPVPGRQDSKRSESPA